MPIPNVSTLYERIHKGSEGGLEFARILNKLLIAEKNIGRFKFTNSIDSSGDFKGVDGIIQDENNYIGVQYKFFPIPFSSKQKNDIKKSIEKALDGFPEMTIWRLITPHNPNKYSLKWIDELSKKYNIEIEHWGHENIMELMYKHQHIGIHYYPELEYTPNLILTKELIHSFFQKFITKDIDTLSLFFQVQPNLADCKIVFNHKYYKEISDIYYFTYRELIENNFEISQLKFYSSFNIKSYEMEEFKSHREELPNGIKNLIDKYNAINTNITFYSVSFLKDKNDLGINYSLWCYVNNRWVLFFKPWKVIESIEKMNNDKELVKITRLLKFFGLRKILKNEPKMKSLITMDHLFHHLFDK